MSILTKKHIANIKPYIPGKPIDEVKRELRLQSVIKLASNENPLPPSPKVLKALTRSLSTINRYPDGGSFYLKRLLAKKFRVKEENIIVGNGSDEIISFAIRAFVDRDEEVMVSRPTFLMYEICARADGVRLVTVPARDFRYDLSAMAERLTPKTKLVFIANPDNPLGTYVNRKELESFLRKVGPRTIVFIDQAYFEFASVFGDYPDALSYLGYNNIIVTRTFSKIYALAGLRVGYGFGSPGIIRAMDKIRDP
ncbi:MAG: aminotransferase class I/II-fold pyridoxal phosphate-dependent enzyme, partial [Candidatus Omnitrophica bacterium]|nr:aminotransferase class I/II-fold pyridoxal phosphate-dependent enzyme [Candidatus Omnitrophota bacterium]